MTDDKDETAPFNEIQGIASTNVPAYSNEDDEFISFEGFYVYGIFTGFKWQCVEYARRWLLLRKSCIFKDFGAAADMWQKLKYLEHVTDGRKFPMITYSNGSPNKPKCDSFLIYPRAKDTPFGHIAVICEVQEDFIRVAEQNYEFHYWPGNYSRQIPMVKRNNLYYIEDYYDVCGWIEIEDNDQLEPLNQSNINLILQKYHLPKPAGKLECCFIPDKTSDLNYSLVDTNNRKEQLLIESNDINISYFKADEDFLLNISSASNELYRLFMETVENIIHNDDLLMEFGIPKQFWSRIRRSWIDECHLDIVDHLDFKFDGKHLKLCQYKADNALTILESAVIQEKWAEAMNLEFDYTSSFQLPHLLVKNWKRLNIQTIIHILIDNDHEEMITAMYMKKVMKEAGIDSKICILSDDLYWKDSVIIDKDGETVQTVWKLWNWKTIFQDYLDQYHDDEEDDGYKSINDKHPCLIDILLNQQIRIIEPIWKSITNHVAFLSVLYSMFPDHPNISQGEWILSEESKHISFVDWPMDEQNHKDIMSYDAKDSFGIDNSMDEYFYYHYLPQRLLPGRNSDKIIVSWIINGLFSGFSIREDQNQIMETNNSITYCCVV